MIAMDLFAGDARLEAYAIEDAGKIGTPALLIYPDIVDRNIRITLGMVGDDPERWRPHIKTAKLGAVIRRMLDHGIRNFKCATTLELLTACQAAAGDVLVAFAMTGANAGRVLALSEQFPKTRVSVLVESASQLAAWRNSGIGVFVDVNPGMNRTGVSTDRADEIVKLCQDSGSALRGLHWYDGHISGGEPDERRAAAHRGYERLMETVTAVQASGCQVEEVITSGTPVAPYAYSYPGFQNASFVHRISPGTVVYNDTTSLRQLAGFGYQAAAVVLTTVISHPLAGKITCDAGHKSVSADAGVPTCAVIGHPELMPLKPSEEHLPIEGPAGARLPEIGENLYLIPRHVCPSVNNFDEALMIVNGRVSAIERVSARGHEGISPQSFPLSDYANRIRGREQPLSA
jgi:D-serine deaminase-like pyridoxal phosphate-dependent protein